MTEKCNGYKNRETYAMCLWLHNDEYINNSFLPGLLKEASGNKYIAGEALKDLFEIDDKMYADIIEIIGEKMFFQIVRDVGSFWRVEWDELFEGLE